MAKDSFYFPHFYNARHDRKIKRLRKDLGIEGYGIFFMLLEVLREQTDFKYPYSDVDLLAEEFGTSTAKVESVLNCYGLFKSDEQKMFFSPKLVYYLLPYLEKSQRARLAANKRWERFKALPDAKAYANALDLDNKCNANQNTSKVNKENEIKESKVEEINKEKGSFIHSITPEKFWNDNFNPITPIIAEYIEDYVDDGIEDVLIIKAMEIAVCKSVRTWSYVDGILKNLKSAGIKTLAQYESHEAERKRKEIENNVGINKNDRKDNGDDEIVSKGITRV